jgi:DNA replication protein DnaC
MKTTVTNPDHKLRARVHALGLHGMLANWGEFVGEACLKRLVDCEEKERQRRSLERRLRNARIGPCKPMVDFDWDWPKRIDRDAVDELFDLGFVNEAANVVLIGQNGVGKTMIAQNLARQAVLSGLTVRFISASEMLNDLASQETSTSLQRRLGRYYRPALLVIDELGYLSYDDRHADLLFEVVSRRHGRKSIVLTTNKPFKEWSEVFPNASCVVALVDRLIHKAEIVSVEGESYRLKEAKERTSRKRADRRSSKAKKITSSKAQTHK